MVLAHIRLSPVLRHPPGRGAPVVSFMACGIACRVTDRPGIGGETRSQRRQGSCPEGPDPRRPGATARVTAPRKHQSPGTFTSFSRRADAGAIQFDFGVTFRYGFAVPDVANPQASGTPVLPLVLERLPATYQLASAAIIIACVVALVLGSIAAMRPRTYLDKTINVISLAGVSTVDFWLGFMLILLFGVHLGWFPTSGYGGLSYLFLPAITLAVRPIGRLTQLVRSAMMDELAKPYIDALRAKGFSETRIVYGHALKNAAIPIATMVGDELLQIIQGAIVIEVVFAWPGVGSLLVRALSSRDLPLVEATVFILALTAIAINLLVDLAHTRLDPRVRFGREGA